MSENVPSARFPHTNTHTQPPMGRPKAQCSSTSTSYTQTHTHTRKHTQIQQQQQKSNQRHTAGSCSQHSPSTSSPPRCTNGSGNSDSTYSARIVDLRGVCVCVSLSLTPHNHQHAHTHTRTHTQQISMNTLKQVPGEVSSVLPSLPTHSLTHIDHSLTHIHHAHPFTFHSLIHPLTLAPHTHTHTHTHLHSKHLL